MKLANLFALTMMLTVPVFGDTVYKITVDASSLTPGTQGFIDLAFNGGYPATAAFGNFPKGGGFFSLPSLTPQGLVTGTLPVEGTMAYSNVVYDKALPSDPLF